MTAPSSRFAGKTVVITGASRGIGAAIAHRFANEGASVLVSANEARVEEVAAAIRQSGCKAAAFIGDVTRKESVVALYDAAEQHFGQVDISIQNAGVITIARIEDMTEDESRPLLDYLLAHGHRPEFTCRFRWANGSVAFWDNRAVKHLAIHDAGPYLRLMRRVQIAGDRPYE